VIGRLARQRRRLVQQQYGREWGQEWGREWGQWPGPPPRAIVAGRSQPHAGGEPGIGLDAARLAAEPDPAIASAPWRLRALPVCASTEIELDRWLEQLLPGREDRLPGPLAVIARRQRYGRGQRGRRWCSPAGGVWLSAALPWPADPTRAAAPALTAAVGLALQLEDLGLSPQIKWPNDLLLLSPAGAAVKIAGILPRLRLQAGRIRWLRLGVGLNGRNPVPAGATNLRAGLGRAAAEPLRLAARVLRALEWTIAHADQPQLVRDLAAQRLPISRQPLPAALLAAEGLDPDDGWQPLALELDGSLLLRCGARRHRLHRSFGAG